MIGKRIMSKSATYYAGASGSGLAESGIVYHTFSHGRYPGRITLKSAKPWPHRVLG